MMSDNFHKLHKKLIHMNCNLNVDNGWKKERLHFPFAFTNERGKIEFENWHENGSHLKLYKIGT
jgi:hypothetical protein